MTNNRIEYKRVLLKISGDGFCKKRGTGLDVEEIHYLADEILEGLSLGAQIAIVVGGGNIIRGSQLYQKGIDPPFGDYMGMLATMINSLALQDVIEKKGAETRVMSAVPIYSVAEPFIRRRCIRHLEKGRIVILAAGTGNPHFTTDTAAALRAIEIHAEILLKATKVDGVCDSDPEINPDAKCYSDLTYLDILQENLKVMDSTAISMCMDNNLPILVFNLKKKGNISKAIRGEKVGTLISKK